MRLRISTAAALTLLAASQAGAQAAPGDRQARVWAASCAACHGTDGRAASTAGIPALAGRSADELLQLLLAFRSGERAGATVMHQHAKGYTDDELRRIAQFFALQPR